MKPLPPTPEAWALAVSYAGGFAAGTFVGGQLANLLIKGDLTLQVITSSRDDALLTAIREAGFAISVLDVNGSEFGSEKYLLIAVMKSNRQKDFRKLLQNLDPHAFILANETNMYWAGLSPEGNSPPALRGVCPHSQQDFHLARKPCIHP